MGESFKINVSEKLVNQLANDAEKLKKKPKKPKLKIAHGSQQPKTAASPNIPKGTPSSGWPLQSPLFLPAPPPTVANAELDAIHSVLQESESVLERVQKQEANMVQEVTHRAKELHDKEFKIPFQKPMPCLAEKDSCLECYRENAKNPLRCASVVKVFADCARVARQQDMFHQYGVGIQCVSCPGHNPWVNRVKNCMGLVSCLTTRKRRGLEKWNRGLRKYAGVDMDMFF